MPRNDARKLNEEQTSLPKTTTTESTVSTTRAIPTIELSDNEILKRIVADIAQTALELKQIERDIIAQEERAEQSKQILSQSGETSIDDKNADDTKIKTSDETVLPSTSDKSNLFNESLKTIVTNTAGSIYPKILELLDQPTITPVESKPAGIADSQGIVEDVFTILPLSEPSPKRRRQRRIYIAEPDRRATLRSRRVETTENFPTSPSSVSPTESKQLQLLEVEDTKSIASTETDYLNSDFWNKIESIDYEEPRQNKRKRGNLLGSRKRAARPRTPTLPSNVVGSVANLELSPSTAAAITAAQLELDSCPTAGGSKKKRTRNMSLYDRRYQTGDERRVGVGNGYISGSARNSSGGSASGTHSDIDSQDMTNQYYMSSSSSNAANASINGSVTLHHAPSMGTLCNIGNTCYLNSVVYTLRFAPYFLHNLHHLMYDLSSIQQTILRQRTAKSASLGRGVNAAHLENVRSWSNKDLASMEQYNNGGGVGGGCSNNGSSSGCGKSSHQSLTEKLHDLYQSLNRNELTDSSEPYHADTLLHAIQDVNATFEGNQQQDAHEFLMCLLNSIRETNQTLIKAIAEYPDVIVNGYIVNPDDVEANYPHERDIIATTSGSAISGAGGSTSTTSSSLSSKASFFSRKSKRKDAKASRLQSPLKDGNNLASTSGTAQPHPTSNSLFYLNTVDLSGASATQSAGTTTLKSISDDEASPAICSLKDKVRLEEKIRELNLDFFSEDFEGVVVLTTKCLSCETITKQKQGMLDISIPVPISGYDNPDYSDKPSAYIQNSCITREYFRGENKYSCDQCTGYTEAIRSISYEVLPRLLLIQLNRFSGGMEKINTYVPTTFTLPCFCVKCCELSDANKLHVYKLYSVITHVGATLSVGHYIAYTCCLDWANEYVNCPKDRRNTSSNQHPTVGSSDAAQTNNGSLAAPVSAAASALASSGTSLMKKMKFGRSKASSSGDMSKNVKQLNGITSKAITNGIGKLSMNTTCHGLNCCAMRFSRGAHPPPQHGSAAGNSASSSDFSEESTQNGTNSNLSYNNNSGSATGSNTSFPSGYGSTGRGGNSKLSYANLSAEPVWYMCDDDKIKAMTQREFEELLSPTRKITITPYLLFYARFDLQPAQPTPPKQTTPTPPHTSWSNESLQSGLQKM